MWDKLLQVDGVRVVQSPGPHRQGMERAFAGGGSVPVCDRGCPAAQDPQRRARDPPERRIGRRGECRGLPRGLGADDRRQRVGGELVGVFHMAEAAGADRGRPGGIRPPRRVGECDSKALSRSLVAALSSPLDAQRA